MRFVPLALLALVAACGGGGGWDPGPTDEVQALVRVFPAPPGPSGEVGWTWCEDGFCTIDVSETVLWEPRRPRFMAHEIGHTFGLQHSNDRDDVMHPLFWLDPWRIEPWQAAEAPGRVVVSVPAGWAEPTIEAAARWNEACGREAVVVVVLP